MHLGFECLNCGRPGIPTPPVGVAPGTTTFVLRDAASGASAALGLIAAGAVLVGILYLFGRSSARSTPEPERRRPSSMLDVKFRER